MRTLYQSNVIAPTEPFELLAINYSHDPERESGITKLTQVIPVLATKIDTYQQKYLNSAEIDLITETSYISPRGEIKIDDFSDVYPAREDDKYACIQVLALRIKGSKQISLLKPSNEKSWAYQCPMSMIDPSTYITYAAEDSHPVLVDHQQLEEDLCRTFSHVTGAVLGAIK